MGTTATGSSPAPTPGGWNPDAYWGPDAYLTSGYQQRRPFFELISRVYADQPRRVIDLGCGPGNLTLCLSERWPGAVVEALDGSPEMIAAARSRGIDAHLGDIATWTPKPDTDVVLSNAVLHFLPGHITSLTRWARILESGSWIAMQVAGNFETVAHAATWEVARREPFRDLLRDMPFQEGNTVETPARYAEVLSDAGCAVDAWETTYIHQVMEKKAELGWITGSSLMHVKTRLSEQLWQLYCRELMPLLDEIYPARPDGRTFVPYRRVFVVAQVN